MCEAAIVVNEQPLITLVLPWVREDPGDAVTEGLRCG